MVASEALLSVFPLGIADSGIPLDVLLHLADDLLRLRREVGHTLGITMHDKEHDEDSGQQGCVHPQEDNDEQWRQVLPRSGL